MAKIGLIDYGSGNFGSVWNALRYLGLDVEAVTRPDQLDSVSHIILPGVGTFGKAMERLRSMDIIDALDRHVRDQDKPFLGICVGFQLLYAGSEESPGAEGLGLFPGKVRRLPEGVKHPQMQWNQLVRRPGRASGLLAGLGESPWAYFVHSYAVEPAQRAHVAAQTEYGERFVSAVRSGRVAGVQFHPERSGAYGRRMLASFLEEVAACSKSSRPSTSWKGASSA